MEKKILKKLEKIVNSFEKHMLLNSVKVDGFGKNKDIKYEEDWRGYRLNVGRTLCFKNQGSSDELILTDPFAKVNFVYHKGNDLVGKDGEKWKFPGGIYMQISKPQHRGFNTGSLEIPRLMEILNKWAESNSKSSIFYLGYLLEPEYLI